jgi:hypothetical protein
VEAGQTVTKVKLSCDNIELAADIIQDLGKFFNWDEMDSEADFPEEFNKFDEVSDFPDCLFSCLSS